MTTNKVFATLLTKQSYLAGTLVLNEGLRESGSKYPLVVMVTPELPQIVVDVLKKCGIIVRTIQPLRPEEGVNTLVDARFQETWTKLRVFELEEFERVVLLDSDMLVKKNIDDLMDISLVPGGIAAVHVCACNPRRFPHYPSDWTPENCAFTAVQTPTSKPPIPCDDPRPYGQLNSGTVILQPSRALAKQLYDFLAADPRVSTFTFPDQDLLTAFFSGKWTALPWYYNALKTLRVIHEPMWDDDAARIVHYILADKPWKSRTSQSQEYEVVNSWWWTQYDRLSRRLALEDEEVFNLLSSTVGA
ncbi:Glycosyltransferase family 8 protein [Mycena indigotica]|uniref:Glycosyltransferase family 8 protein n=1 Tax=Mycena indigotica TaxID=2126181 RepID=A0A8H6WC65_9AGAR|nr:Glycosyltransferase family 8 protein [Mycena indigotica]KAF7307029.1 Glycosyltransferase family 8 protein [Mycena indigotica]